MTTKITIENDGTSNGDVHIVTACGFATPEIQTLLPGDKFEEWISTGHVISVYETWPTTKKAEAEPFPVTVNEHAHGDDHHEHHRSHG